MKLYIDSMLNLILSCRPTVFSRPY